MDMGHTVNPEVLSRQYRENIVAFRTKEKADFETWKAGLLKCSKTLLSKIPYDVSTWRFEEMFSELYEEWPDPDVYEAQYTEYLGKIEEINNIVSGFIEEALELIERAIELQARDR